MDLYLLRKHEFHLSSIQGIWFRYHVKEGEAGEVHKYKENLFIKETVNVISSDLPFIRFSIQYELDICVFYLKI